MQLIGRLIEKLQRHPRRIVFAEGSEPRVLQAARQFHCLRLGAPILLGNRAEIEKRAAEYKVPLEHIRIINPEESEDLDKFADMLRLMHQSHGMKLSEARETMRNPNYFGAMMVAMRQADGLVTGATQPTAVVLRAVLQTIQLGKCFDTAVGCTVVELENVAIGESGVLVLADCAVVPEPTMEQLGDIAVAAAQFARQLFGFKPRVAMLSYATRCRSLPPALGKVHAAIAIAQRKAKKLGLDAEFDGEMQIDTALVPDVAAVKMPKSKVAGRANVLIFPCLAAADIAGKALKHLARAQAYGHILLGLDRPAADVSRGANSRDILGVAALVGVQSIAYRDLYPETVMPGQ
ncbi:MAG: phosphate acyltransferase [Verrucomicrobiales bacterium]|nr:phosphate acyltransferase [Verrucomicrobiales bacterium]